VQRGTSLLQLRRNLGDSTKQVVQFLQQRADKLGSKALALVAARAEDDPFAKVTKMIEDLIAKLMEEANSEAEHHGWCTQELADNKATRDEKTKEVERLDAEIEERTARSQKLQDTIKKLQAYVSELNEAVAKATAQRDAERAKNQQTIAEAKDAIEAVGQATKVLKEFYAKAASSTALVAAPEDDAPPTFDESFTGDQSGSTGVIGMLEVVLSDFVRLESETTTDEQAAAREFKKFSTDSKVDLSEKDRDIRQAGFKLDRNEKHLHSAEKDLASTQEELDAAMAYFDKLKPDCVDPGLSYEERVQKRKEEIESLQEALQLLGGDSNILDSQGA